MTDGDDARLAGIGQVSMPVTDIDRSIAFYRDGLGLAHLYTYGDLAFFDCDGTRLFLNASVAAPRPPSATALYFRVSEIESAYRALRARGVAFEDAPHLIHTHPDGSQERMAFLRDPDGNLIGLMSVVRPN